jgi:hypothetical protein
MRMLYAFLTLLAGLSFGPVAHAQEAQKSAAAGTGLAGRWTVTADFNGTPLYSSWSSSRRATSSPETSTATSSKEPLQIAGGTTPPPPPSGTPAGSYTVKMTATSGNLTHTTLTLIVQ